MKSTESKIFNILGEDYPKKLLVEDDCAPDAFSAFDTKASYVLGMSVKAFKENAELIVITPEDVTWVSGSYLITIAADEPQHKLYKRG